MNRLLRFTRKDINDKFYKDAKPYLRFANIILFFNLVVRSIGFGIIQFAFRPDLFASGWYKKLLMIGIHAVIMIGVYRLERMFAKFENRKIFKKARLIILVMDAIGAAIILGYFLGLGVDLNYSGSTRSKSYLAGIATAVHLIFLVLTLLTWYQKLIVITVALIYYSWKEYGGEVDDKILVGAMVLNIIMMWALLYLKERAQRTMYLKRMIEFENSQAWKKILDEYPEGVLILAQEGNCKFSNFSMSKTLKAENIGPSSLEMFKNVAFVGFNENLSNDDISTTKKQVNAIVLHI